MGESRPAAGAGRWSDSVVLFLTSTYSYLLHTATPRGFCVRLFHRLRVILEAGKYTLDGSKEGRWEWLINRTQRVSGRAG